VIKTSALLVVVAIGLLVAGVLASSLLMVYVSIGVCAVAALLLAAGVLSHWSEIFGLREPRPSGVPQSWSAPQVPASAPVPSAPVPSAPVLASAQATGVQGQGDQVTGAEATGTRAPGTPAREDRRSRRGAAARRPPAPLAEVVSPQAGFAVPGRGDDLWERVEEELGSGGRRDTGALSWPAIEVPVLREPAPGEAGPPGTPPAGSSAWIWGQGAGWQPPSTPDEAWPPPAAAFAGSPPARPEPATVGPDDRDTPGRDVERPDQQTREPESPAPAGPARGAGQAAPGSLGEAARKAPETAPPKRDTWDERPRWIISVGDADPARPVPQSAVSAPPARERPARAPADEPAPVQPAPSQPPAGKPEAAKPAAGKPEAAEPKPTDAGPEGAESEGAADVPPPGEPAAAEPTAGKPRAEEPAAEEPAAEEPVAEEPAAEEPAAEEPAAEEPVAKEPAAKEPAAEEPVAKEPAAEESPAGQPAAEEPAAGEPGAGGPAGKPVPGRIEVTVVPGVARYHRSECILIRFLGAGDLEIMTRQEAEQAKFAACRACQPDQLEA
jgi:hypothetical protein